MEATIVDTTVAMSRDARERVADEVCATNCGVVLIAARRWREVVQRRAEQSRAEQGFCMF